MVKNDEEIENKEELEAELLRVRSEIQWREREKEEQNKYNGHYLLGTFIWTLFLYPSFYLFGEAIGIIFWIISFVFMAIIVEKSFNKTKEGKKYQKARKELAELKKRKTELENKLDNLESKNYK